MLWKRLKGRKVFVSRDMWLKREGLRRLVKGGEGEREVVVCIM